MDETIVNRLKHKDEQAFNELIDNYSGAVYYLLKRMIGMIATHEDLEEMTSDVFVAVWNQIDEFNEERGSFQTFIYMKAKYCALTFKRKHERQQEQQDLREINDQHIKDESSLEYVMNQKWFIKQVMTWIDELKEPDRSYFILKYFQYYKTKEIANHFKTSVKAVESSLYRTRKHLLNLREEENR